MINEINSCPLHLSYNPSYGNCDPRENSTIAIDNMNKIIADINDKLKQLGFVLSFRGILNKNSSEVVPTDLTARIIALCSRAPVRGDILLDRDNNMWLFSYIEAWVMLPTKFDTTPTENSLNLVNSGSVYAFVLSEIGKVSATFDAKLKLLYDQLVLKIDAGDVLLDNKLTSNISAVTDKINMHVQDASNPHRVNKGQVGLDLVDNTADLDKPLSDPQKQYVDAEIAKIIGSGPGAAADNVVHFQVEPQVSDADGSSWDKALQFNQVNLEALDGSKPILLKHGTYVVDNNWNVNAISKLRIYGNFTGNGYVRSTNNIETSIQYYSTQVSFIRILDGCELKLVQLTPAHRMSLYNSVIEIVDYNFYNFGNIDNCVLKQRSTTLSKLTIGISGNISNTLLQLREPFGLTVDDLSYSRFEITSNGDTTISDQFITAYSIRYCVFDSNVNDVVPERAVLRMQSPTIYNCEFTNLGVISPAGNNFKRCKFSNNNPILSPADYSECITIPFTPNDRSDSYKIALDNICNASRLEGHPSSDFMNTHLKLVDKFTPPTVINEEDLPPGYSNYQMGSMQCGSVSYLTFPKLPDGFVNRPFLQFKFDHNPPTLDYRYYNSDAVLPITDWMPLFPHPTPPWQGDHYKITDIHSGNKLVAAFYTIYPTPQLYDRLDIVIGASLTEEVFNLADTGVHSNTVVMAASSVITLPPNSKAIVKVIYFEIYDTTPPTPGLMFDVSPTLTRITP